MKKIKYNLNYLKLIYWKWYNNGELRMREWEELFELRRKLYKK